MSGGGGQGQPSVIWDELSVQPSSLEGVLAITCLSLNIVPYHPWDWPKQTDLLGWLNPWGTVGKRSSPMDGLDMCETL